MQAFMELLKLQEQPELLKSDGNDAQSFDYWDVVFKLVMQGCLEDAIEVMVMHSEISSAFILNSDDASSSSAFSQYSTLDPAQCRALFDLMLMHPYYDLTDDVSADASRRNQRPILSFSVWQAQVKNLLHSQNELLVRIPQLDKVLRILLGEMEELSEMAGSDWILMSLAMLFYVYPPPLTRVNLSQIVNEAVQCLEGGFDANGRPRVLM